MATAVGAEKAPTGAALRRLMDRGAMHIETGPIGSRAETHAALVKTP